MERRFARQVNTNDKGLLQKASGSHHNRKCLLLDIEQQITCGDKNLSKLKVSENQLPRNILH